MYKDNQLVERYKNSSRQTKALIIIGFLVYVLILFVGSCWFGGWIIYPFSDRTVSKIYLGLHKGLVLSLIIFVALLVMTIIALFKSPLRNSVALVDERKVALMENGSRGTAHYATPEEMEKFFTVDDIRNVDEVILGQLTQDGEQVIAYKVKTKGAPGTRHILVIAPSGLGKTFSFVYINIIQAVIRGESMLIVDPSGQIYTKLGQYCRNSFYDTKLLNLANLDYSECWDCLAETIDPTTERIDAQRLQSFAKIYTKNSAKGDDEDYWYECAVNLIETVIGYCAWLREKEIIENYHKLYDRITKGSEGTKFSSILDTQFVSFPWCEKKLYEFADKKGIDRGKVEKAIRDIKKYAPKYNIEVVYDKILHFNKYESQFASMPAHHPGYAAFRRYQAQTKESVREGAIQGAQMKFKIFDNEKLRKVLSQPGIDFNTINKRKSAYFLAIPDNDSLFKPIASLFFSFFYRDAQAIYDLEESTAVFENRQNKCIPVMCMMDEFSSLGVITGDEAEFGTIMSDARKRKIYNIMIAQYYSQLEGNYGKYTRDAIVSNCSTFVCLGANDQSTKEFVAEMCGVSTVMNESHREYSTLFGGTRPEDNSMSVSSVERYLLTPDEVGNLMDKVLIKRHGAGPIIANPAPWTIHPDYINDKCPEVSYKENIKSLEVDPWEAYDRKIEKDDGAKIIEKDLLQIGGLVRMNGQLVDDTTGEIIEEVPKKKKNKNPKAPIPKGLDSIFTNSQQSREDLLNTNSSSSLDD